MAAAPESITIKLVVDVEDTNAKLNDALRKVTAGMRAAWFLDFRPIPNPLADAFDAGFTACAEEHSKQRAAPEYPITRANPYRRARIS